MKSMQTATNLFNYLENSKTYRKSVMIIKRVFHFSLQLLFKNAFHFNKCLVSYTRDAGRYTHRSSRRAHYYRLILTKIGVR
jgi:hypothetical protein